MKATLSTQPTSQLSARLNRGCDRCGAPFVDVAVLPNGSELQFCGHHYREHSDALNRIGAVWNFGYSPNNRKG